MGHHPGIATQELIVPEIIVKRFPAARSAMTIVAVLGWVVVATGAAALAYVVYAGAGLAWAIACLMTCIGGYLHVAAAEIGVAIIATAEATADMAAAVRSQRSDR